MSVFSKKHGSREAFFSKKAWRYFAEFYKGNYKKLTATSIGSAAQALIILPMVLLIRYAFDEIIPNKDINQLLIVGLVIFGLRIINALVSLWLRTINIKIINSAIYKLRDDIISKLYSFSRNFHTREDHKIIHARIVQDSERLANLSTALVSRLFPAIFTCLGLGILLIYLNWLIFLIILALFPMIYLANQYMGRKIKKHVFNFQRAFEKFSRSILFILRFMNLTIIQSEQKREVIRQKKTIEELKEKTNKMAYIFAVNAQVQEILTGLSGIIIIIAGGIAVVTKDMTLGEFLSFYVAASFLNRQINVITTSIPEVVTGNESMKTIYDLVKTEDFHPYLGTKKINFKGNIELNHVSFKYENDPVLENVNLKIKPGSKLAIIGRNGAGKTTIMNLILGLYKPDEGKLLAENIPYDDLDISYFRQSIGVVMQHPPLFSGTVRENILYGSGDKEDQLIEACKYALADDFIRRLPNGYETQIGEDGVLLSGGECQRLAIARALVRKPSLLILDEPTNHLDSNAVKEIMDSLDTIKERPAFLIISHDMSVINHAETIYQLENKMLLPLKEKNSNKKHT